MTPLARLALAVLALPALVAPATGGPCDCVRRVGLCLVDTAVDPDRVTFTIHTEECARLTWSVNGEMNSITTFGGPVSIAYGTGERLAQTSVTVDACFICDTTATAADRRGYGPQKQVE